MDGNTSLKNPAHRPTSNLKVLGWCWFGAFTLHIVFLAMGIYWLNEGYKMIDASELTRGELRVDSLFLALYLQSIAFSMILLLIAIYTFVIQSRQEKLLQGQARLLDKISDLEEKLGER